MPAQLANKGYLSLKKEVTPGVAVIPDVQVPLYEDSLATDPHYDEDNPIVGSKLKRFQVLQGIRSHGGDVKVLAEPNTAARFFDMLLHKTGSAGSSPTTHTFALDFVDPNSYTVDIARGRIVFRYMGVQASGIEPDFDENKMVFNVTIAALKSLGPVEVASVAGNIATLKTAYDPAPATGFVINDLVTLWLANGTTVNTTVTGVSATTITLASVAGLAGNDFIALRPAANSISISMPFLWARTEFRFGPDAATALGAAQLQLEPGSKWNVIHEFEEDEGSKRSGSFDPAALLRTTGDVEFTAKQTFDTPDEYARFLALTKRACVIRHFSETGYELRITLNHVKTKELPVNITSDEIIYHEATYIPVYDTADGQGFDVKVLNPVSSI